MANSSSSFHTTQTATQELAALAYSPTASRVGLWSLLAGLLFFLIWAAVAPIDEGVPTQGLVTVDTKRKTVQHLQGGIVREVRVHEGEMVREGQVLMTIEQAALRAGMESVRQHYLSLRATESRLLAEQQQLSRITWHPDVLKAAADPVVQQQMAAQAQLFDSRRAALDANVSSLNENLNGLQAQQQGAERMQVQRQQQLKLFQQELTGIRDLVREGYAPRSREFELERNVAEVSSSLADIEANQRRLASNILEVRQRMQIARHEYRKETDNLLAEIRREVQADAEKLTAVTQDLERAEIRSPANGQVVGLVVQTVGAVITPGQKLMDIVPDKAPLLIEARVPPQVIDRLQPGQAADIRFSAFAHSPQLVAQGRLLSVSTDLLTEAETRQSYYLARLQLTPEGLKTLGNRTLQAGMMTEVVIRTGERSLLTYLAYPLVRRLSQSMREE